MIACSCSAAAAWSKSLHHGVVNSWRVGIKFACGFLLADFSIL